MDSVLLTMIYIEVKLYSFIFINLLFNIINKYYYYDRN